MSSQLDRRKMDTRLAIALEQHQTILENQREIERGLNHQHDCIERLKNAVEQHTEIVEEVRELLSALKGFSTIAKWATVTGGFFTAVWHGTKAVISFIGRT